MATSSTPIPPYKSAFIQSCISASVLTFGNYTLKSGRISPYFFNAGLFHTGDLTRSISTAFARSIHDYQSSHPDFDFDVLFGPAYKGIPLAATTVYALADLDPKTYKGISYSFDRKEAKTHGDGGNIVGAALRGKKVMIIDDVVTAGTAKREAIDTIWKEGGEVVGLIVALDRMEKMPKNDGDDSQPGPSAIGEIRREYGIPVLSIITLDDLIEGLNGRASEKEIERMVHYGARFRAKDL